MKTKFLNLLIVSSFFLLGNYSFGQFGVNGPKSFRDPYCFKDRLDDEDYKKLKKSKVYFVCTNDLFEEEEDIQSILDDAWNYSDIEIIKASDFVKYKSKENCAFFTLGSSNDYKYYILWMLKDHTKEIIKDNTIEFAEFCLFNNYKADSAWWQSTKNDQSPKYSAIDYYYRYAKFSNFKPYIVANYLKLIEKYLDSKKDHRCNANLFNELELKKLRNDTLYIANNILTKMEPKWKTYKFTMFNEEDLMSKYPHPYKFISFEEINEKIKRDDNFYYCIGISLSILTMKLSIFKGKTGECVYNETPCNDNYYCIPKDFGRIAAYIK